jgi:GTP:adenosylcobinamide-phosphate guanylyltransferase
MVVEKVGAVIVAAGSSQRMGDVDKMFAQLGGKPVLGPDSIGGEYTKSGEVPAVSSGAGVV